MSSKDKSKLLPSIWTVGAFCAAVLGLLLPPALAAAGPQVPTYRTIAGASAEPLPPRPLAAGADLDRFVGEFMRDGFAKHRVVGGSLVIFKDGRILTALGFGFRDRERRLPVLADRTLFRTGSVSKLFTWTAVMQLVEQGRLDLDVDVNRYLRDFKVPPTFRQPVTLRNLMTHTAGFEDGELGFLTVDSERRFEPLGASLLRHMPRRVRPPTTDFANDRGAAYSNWGTALAGYIVAQVSGLPFEEYVARNILGPLGMTRSSFDELSVYRSPDMAVPYSGSDGPLTRRGFEFIHNFAPAGALSATAVDMARFGMVHLQFGKLDGNRILREPTSRLMQARSNSQDPHVNGGALGFYETYVNGRRTIGHGGATDYFMSELVLIPEAGTGYFIAFNTPEGAELESDFKKAFMDRYFPARLPTPKVASGAEERARQFAGTYRSQRLSSSLIDRVGGLLTDTIVKALPGGRLSINGATWLEAGPGVYRRVDDDRMVAFRPTEGGGMFLAGSFVAAPKVRIGLFETGSFSLIVLGLSLIGCVAVMITFLLSIRRFQVGRNSRISRWALLTAGVLNLASVPLIVWSFLNWQEETRLSPPAGLYLGLTLPMLAILATLGGVGTYLASRRTGEPAGGRILLILGVTSCLALDWFLSQWNLLGYRFG